MGPAHTLRRGGKTGRRPLVVAPFPIEAADVLGARTIALCEMRPNVCRGSRAQGDATLTLAQAPKTGNLFVSRPWP